MLQLSGHFYSTYYNWYAYYKKRVFHKCPECGCKLVANYDFEKTGSLDKITIRFFIFAAVAYAIDYWNFYNVGFVIYGIPAIAGGVTHVMYWWSLSGEEKELQDTKKFEE